MASVYPVYSSSSSTLKLVCSALVVSTSFASQDSHRGDVLNPISLIVSSNAGLRMEEQPSVEWSDNSNCVGAGIISVIPDSTHQVMGGFGASMTEASAMNLNSLSNSSQTELMDLVFSETGAHFSAIKATMLSNDFATQAPWSTYDDVENDYSLGSFSIERDLRVNGSLTFIKRAIEAGFEGIVQAYVDYPPDWMLEGDLPDNATLRTDCYDVMAQYFANFVIAYANEGVQIDFLETFNEPTDSYTKMNPTQLATFLGQHLGPLFDQLGLHENTKLTYGAQCWRSIGYDFVNQVMTDKQAAAYMDVITYHGYDCQFNCTDNRQNYDAIAKLAQQFSHIPLWMTEICYAYNGDDPNCNSSDTLQYCTDYPSDPTLAPPLPIFEFSDGPIWGHRIVKEIQAGASGWIYWNLFLDMEGGPFLLSAEHNDGEGNYQHPLIIVDGPNDTYYPTGAFWFLAHFSKYVRPSYLRIDIYEDKLPSGVSVVGFKSPDDGTITLQIVSKSDVDTTISVCDGTTQLAVIPVPALSITTAQW